MPPMLRTPTFGVEQQNSGITFQASLRIVVTCLSPDVRRCQVAIFVEQVSMTTIFITYIEDARRLA